ncbi:MAG: indolepyruvate oxidoreductase subunit beta family protein [Pigmentiphaga sp.]|nr:indolepyruvate oxidoreductase subunit beta family protein [Pigmentiphaga sp.]
MRVDATTRPLKIAILAMGGEGGGVLADWIVQCAERQGYYAQSTSVPGVAQRTGATIYYVEVLAVARDSRQPIFGLMPTPGDVDVVIASELMECGRAVQRGLVTPDRTLLIASRNRVYTLTEKATPGDGRIDAERILEQARQSARLMVCRDFSSLAERHRSVISATLFGAFAASGVAPWDRAACEQAIREGGIGVEASLAAFGAGFEAYRDEAASAAAAVSPPEPPAELRPILDRVRAEFPPQAAEVLEAGVAKTANYQDAAYAALLLKRLEPIRDLEASRNDPQATLLRETARYLALWMTYEDTIRVAQLKMRAGRFGRIHDDVGGQESQLVHIHEYFHPRPQEIADVLPAPAGRWLLRSSWLRPLLSRLTRRGRVIRTSSLGGFLLLYAVYSLRGLRRHSLRFEREAQEIQEWLDLLARTAAVDYRLACELAECPRLIKGYGDTYERGLEHYRLILQHLPFLKGARASTTIREWRQAALGDETGARLRSLLASVSSPTAPSGS